jgi:site-specific recombinase XerD
VYWIRFKRQKTGSKSHVPLLDIPNRILHKHCNVEDILANETIFKLISNQKINAYLKEIADVCRIEKCLTFHMARHTFATTITISNGVPIETVSKMLGHKDLRSTQHYAKIVDEKVGNDMRILATKLNL